MAQILKYILCIVLLMGGSARAESELLVLRDIQVSLPYEANVDIRELALEEAQRLAYQQWQKEHKTAPEMLSNKNIRNLVQGIKIQKEFISSKRYEGRFDVSFRASKLHVLLYPQTSVIEPVVIAKKQRNLGARVSFSSFDEWLWYKQHLQALDKPSLWHISELSRHHAQISLNYDDLESLHEWLGLVSLRLNETDAGWNIERKESWSVQEGS